MARKKKILLSPKSSLGLNKELRICYNCMFWNHESGRCPWDNDNHDYNTQCLFNKLFRYNTKYGFKTDNDTGILINDTF